MGILSTVKNFIVNDILGVSNDTQVKPAQKAQKSEKPNAVVSCKNVGKNEDTIEVKNRQKNVKSTTNAPKRSAGQIRESIKNKCQSNNISFAEVLRKLPEVAGLTKEKFDTLTTDQQIEVLTYLEQAVDRTIKLQKKHGSSKETNTAEVVTETAKNRYEAKKAGVNLKSMDEEAGNILDELGKDFDKLSREEKRAKFREIVKSRKEAFEQHLKKELAKVAPEKRADVEARIRAEHEHAEKARFNEVLATKDSDSALEAVITLPAKNMGRSFKVILKTRVNSAERTKTADKANFAYTESLLKDYYERGEKPSSEVVQDFTQANIAAKSAQAVNEYQADYKARRNKYEAGEDRPAYLSDDFFTSTAKGIGEGALANTNMSADEKAEFISNWQNDAKKYDDYEVVTEHINKTLETKSEYKEIADKIKVINEQKAVAKTAQRVAPEKAETAPQTYTTTPQESKVDTTYTKIAFNNGVKKEEKTDFAQVDENKTTSQVPRQTNNLILITKEIKSTSISDAIKKFGHATVIETVLDNQSLKHMRPQLTTIIKGYDLNTLKKLAKNCSTSSFLYICSIVNKEFVAELKDERKDLCYSARKEVENMEKQYA